MATNNYTSDDHRVYDDFIYILYAPIDLPLACEVSEKLRSSGFNTWLCNEQKALSEKERNIGKSESIRNAFAIIAIITKKGIKEGYPKFEHDFVLHEMKSENDSERLISCIIGRGVYQNKLPFKNTKGFRINRRKWKHYNLLVKTLLSYQSRNNDRKKLNEDGVEGLSNNAILPNCSGVLFLPDELDIHVNEITGENNIFYGKDIDENIAKIEFHHREQRMAVFFGDGAILDLGVRIQWLILPFIASVDQISVVQTKDGKAITGKVVPVVHIGKTNRGNEKLSG